MKPHTVVGDCKLYVGDARKVLPKLKAGLAQVAISSPPYWNLRSYLPKGAEGKDREIGQEKTPGEYIDNLVETFRGVRQVLHRTGTLWVNIGDSMGENGFADTPHHLKDALIDDGWNYIAEIIWVKRNTMPECLGGWREERCMVKVPGTGWGGDDGSVHPSKTGDGKTMRRNGAINDPKDGVAKWKPCPGCKKCHATGGWVFVNGHWRPTRAHEYLYLFAKSADYFIDPIPVRRIAAESTLSRDQYTRIEADAADEQRAVRHDHETLSKGTANVWSYMSFPAEQLKGENHTAAFPVSLPNFCLRASTSRKGQCLHCGTPWCPRVQYSERQLEMREEAISGVIGENGPWNGRGVPGGFGDGKVVGWVPRCDCPKHQPVLQTVLDPFGGSFTTGVASARAGRKFIGIDLNADYLKIGQRRLKKAMANVGPLGLNL